MGDEKRREPLFLEPAAVPVRVGPDGVDRREDKASTHVDDKAPAHIDDKAPARMDDKASTHMDDKAPAHRENKAPARREDKAPAHTEGNATDGGHGLPAPTMELSQHDMHAIIARAVKEIIVSAKKKKRRRKAEIPLEQKAHASYLGRFLICLPFCGRAMARKYLDSKLVAFLEGHGVHSDDTDTLVNSITLVNALLLTIPPGIITSLGINSSSWDNIETFAANCNLPGTQLFVRELCYVPVFRLVVGSFTTSFMALVIAIAYFVLRPVSRHDDDEDEEGVGEGALEVMRQNTEKSEFQIWWHHGRFAVFIMAASVITALICLVLLLVFYLFFFFLNQVRSRTIVYTCQNSYDDIKLLLTFPCHLVYMFNRGTCATYSRQSSIMAASRCCPSSSRPSCVFAVCLSRLWLPACGSFFDGHFLFKSVDLR